MADTKAAAFKFTTNIPVRTLIKFVDVRPGKPWTDPATGQTKQLPAQVSIKGVFDGVETIAFLPGATWKNIKALSAAGIINEQDTDALEAVTAVTNIPLATREEFIATLAKPAGAKYADMVYRPVAAQPAPTQSQRVKPTEAGPPYEGIPTIPRFDVPREQRVAATIPAPSGPSLGGPIAGLDDDERFEQFSRELDSLDPHAQPALTPREEANTRTPLEALCTQYTTLYALVFADLLATHSAAVTANRAPASRAAEAVPPLTAEAIQSATATVWIEANKRGLLR